MADEDEERLRMLTIVTERKFAIHAPDQAGIDLMVAKLLAASNPMIIDNLVSPFPGGSMSALALDRPQSRLKDVGEDRERRLMWRPHEYGGPNRKRVWHPSWPGDVFQVMEREAFIQLVVLCEAMGVSVEEAGDDD